MDTADLTGESGCLSLLAAQQGQHFFPWKTTTISEDGRKYKQSIVPAEHQPAGTSDQASPSLHFKTHHRGVNLVLIPILFIGNESLAIQTI